MRKMGLIFGAIAQFLALAPAHAAADVTTVVSETESVRIEQFGNVGQWAPLVEVDASSSANSEVGALYFVGDNVALGLGVGGGYQNQNDANLRTATLNVAPKLALNLRLSDNVSFLPTVSFAYNLQWQENNANSATAATSQYRNGLTAELFIPLLAHINNRFFIGFGPQAAIDVLARNNASGNTQGVSLPPDLAVQGNFASRNFRVGGRAVVGAWL